MKKRFILILASLVLAPAAHALDNARLAQHLRETLGLDIRTPIEVQGAPTPSGFGDLSKIAVLVGGQPYDVFLSKDEKTYFWGFTGDLTKMPDAQRVAAINLTNARSTGSVNAPVTLVEYSDLACSHCKRAHELIRAQVHKVYKPSQVRWVFKHYPLTSHPWALPAAAAAECAGEQKPDAFWTMADYFYANQDKVTEANVKELAAKQAAKLGLKAGAFASCYDDPAVRGRVQEQKKEGAAVGVSSTPTFFVNGRMRRGFRDFEDLKVLIDEKLKAAGK